MPVPPVLPDPLRLDPLLPDPWMPAAPEPPDWAPLAASLALLPLGVPLLREPLVPLVPPLVVPVPVAVLPPVLPDPEPELWACAPMATRAASDATAMYTYELFFMMKPLPRG